MNRFKFYYYLTILIVIAVTAALAFLVVYPTWMFYWKASSPVNLEAAGGASNSQSLGWMVRSLKTRQVAASADTPGVMLFMDKASFTEENLQKIDGDILIFERLYSQLSESPYDLLRLAYLTGIDYSGFTGATYEDLANRANIPQKLIELYETSSGRPWNFFGEGIIIANDSTAVVLRRGIEYNGGVRFTAGELRIGYQGIFEITASDPAQAAQFSLDLRPAGAEIFASLGLPDTFPALRQVNRNLYQAYYFAGDFSNFAVDVPAGHALLPGIMRHKLLYTKFTNEEVFWRWYYPAMEEIFATAGARVKSGRALVDPQVPPKAAVFSISGQDILISDGQSTREFFIKGVNLGPALPGRYFTEPADDLETYLEWFRLMAGLNINTVRVYTLLPPSFYQALYEFNQGRPAPIYLLQEIWPEEYPADANFLNAEYNRAYRQEIDYVVHAVHGSIQIPPRDFRAYGLYTYDVSPYLIGYLVGRELEPDEVLATDELNQGYEFEGEYLYSLPEASPTEAWLAASCDYTLALEDSAYQNRPLAAIVSWPTLDPLEHNSEWNKDGDKSRQYNDKAVVDINHIAARTERGVGFFGAYHIYPNYPDFMNNDVAYEAYSDDQGRFQYGGYLQAFIEQHMKYPAVVAEYGISTSAATAHYNPDGYHHGGLDETQQANGIMRMTDAILREGYSGAVIFEWMDEWVKKTWTTEFYMIPYERHVFWHNVLDPEQNYGLLAFEPAPADMRQVYRQVGQGQPIQEISAGQNSQYIEIQINGSADFDPTQPFEIAISTYAEEGERAPVWEYLLKLDSQAQLLVNPGYNWLEGRYAAMESDFEAFEELIQLTNSSNLTREGVFTPEKKQNLSLLAAGPFDNNQGQVEYAAHSLRVRLAYGLLGISDPSSAAVLYDEKEFIPTAADQISTRQSGEVVLRVIQPGQPEIEASLPLQTWESPTYTPRLKDSFKLLADYFGRME